MARSRNTFALGLTVIVMLALFFVVLVFIGSREPWGLSYRTITIRFAPTLTLPPLKEDSTILFAGRPVGSIRRLWLKPNVYKDKETGEDRELMFLYVTATVRSDLDLRSDCAIVPEGPILGGAGLLRIQDQGKSDEPLGPDQVIEGQGMGGFAAVTEQMTEIGGYLSRELDATQEHSIMALIKTQLDAEKPGGMVAHLIEILTLIEKQLDAEQSGTVIAKLLKTMTDLNAVSGSIRDQLDPEQERALLSKLHLTLDHINAITGELQNQTDPGSRSSLMGKLQLALDSVNTSLADVSGMLSENRPIIHTTLQNVEETSETLNTGIAKAVADELERGNPNSLTAKIHTSIDRLGASLKDINEITDTVGDVVALNKGSLDKILSNFKETSDHLKAATKDLRRNPWRLLYQPSLSETKELNIFDAARAFAEAATRLDDATARLEGLAEARKGELTAADPQVKAIRAELRDTFQKFSEAEAALWKTLNIKPK